MHEEDAGLRARLIEVGVELVTREGTQALSLREIARRAGVSHGAPRRYFPTHLELLSAIAREGFAALGAEVTRALGDGRADPRAQLTTLGQAYLDFALANRGMYELMFRHDLLESNHLGLREASLPLFDVVVDLLTRAGLRPGVDPRIAAGALWANAHGLAQLWAWGSLQPTTGSAELEPLLRAVLEAHLGPEPQ
ncbi:TetR/AcrR family transcriptional regulator [Nonomuraea sp. NPDC050691]|uniref:TetR/AcrR family transcriptional regulator n=1 Tax=Nonomuraea sp. NPDC050691 TaxID=3155661 RepID=UPI0033ED6FD3